MSSSSHKLFSSDTEIPVNSINYIQIGAEDLEDGISEEDDPAKSFCSSAASLYISAEYHKVRIRLQDKKSAASLAEDLRNAAAESKKRVTFG